MRNNSPKKKSQRLRASVARAVLALILLGLLAVPVVVQAELKATSLAYAWDFTSGEFFHGHVTIAWNGAWIPLLQEVYFDHLARPSDDPNDPLPCADPDEMTRYAGWIEYGLPFLDNDPPGAEGFQDSQNWTLIDCDLNGDGTWNDADLVEGPEVLDDAEVLAECTPDEGARCQILHMDDPEEPLGTPEGPSPCTVATEEHCAYELAVRLWINLDTDCDGVVDDPSFEDAAALCVYADALTPVYEEGDDMWTFPLPVRISDKDGAKTLMLYPFPTAVELASFSAKPQGNTVLVSWETATELDNLGFNLYRANSGGGERTRLNEWLIASQSPGSTMGSSYQFVDHTAQPGRAYDYWLEDVDLGDMRTMNGPVAVQMPRARLLPCRPRPAPMPVGQIE